MKNSIFAFSMTANMKRIFVIAIMLFTAQLQAQVRMGESEAIATAEYFLGKQAKQKSHALSLNETIFSQNSKQANLFVFSMKPHGFIIVSAVGEILAYSFDNDFPKKALLPDHIAYWIDLYNDQTDYLIAHPELDSRKLSNNKNAIGPLLTSCWGQGCFHNAACPEDEHGPCGNVSAGCVAIAMAQIMYYHKQPLTGAGVMSYTCSPYGTLSANFGQTTYHWEEMVDTLREDNSAVAELIYHCGVSLKTDYGAQQSSASNSDAINAFRQFFYYPNAILFQRRDYCDEEWRMMIIEDLDRQRPVYYSGISNIGGHAFVCDGYDNNGLFHFNFGWDGVANGFYTLDNPSGFFNSQAIITNIYSAFGLPINSDEHGIIYVTPDGAGNGSSWEQATAELQAAIFKSSISDCSIWVKEGCYYGHPSDNQAFLLLNNAKLYGGFKGDEPYDYDLSQRDFEAHSTHLDGNHTQGVINVLSYSDSPSILIDGFTIQNGNSSQGGGVFSNSNMHIRNCIFRSNYSMSNGGGISIHSRPRSIIEDCKFIGNEARKQGGAVDDYGNATYFRCEFRDNHAGDYGGGIKYNSHITQSLFINCILCNNTAQYGGGIASYGQGPTLWNCLINNNTANAGGGCFFKNATASLFNCTIVKNEALEDYGGVFSSESSPQDNIKNCIIWGNISQGEFGQIGPIENYSNCAVENNRSNTSANFAAAAENDGDAPFFYIRFVDPGNVAGYEGQGGDWHLQPNSLCIDRAESITDQPETDLEGFPRHRHKKVDLGAYESNSVAHFINGFTCEHNPYSYNNTLFPDIGTYSFLHHGITHDSLVILQLSYPTVHISKEICEGETYDFFGTALHTSGHYSDTADCKTYELDLTVNLMHVIALEESICEGETFNFFGTFLHNPGHYSDTVDCNIYELDLNVSPMPVIAMEETICEGETYNFFGAQLHDNGHYSTQYNCEAYELDLTVKPTPNLSCSNDTIVEYGHEVILTASGAETYLWSTGDTTSYITIAPKKDMTYSVRGFSQTGCSTTAYVTVKVTDENDKMVLYPNPTNDKVEIFMPLIDEVEIIDLMGTIIERVDANREAVELDVSQYSNGIYIVHVRQLNNHNYEKLVIKH